MGSSQASSPCWVALRPPRANHLKRGGEQDFGEWMKPRLTCLSSSPCIRVDAIHLVLRVRTPALFPPPSLAPAFPKAWGQVTQK